MKFNEIEFDLKNIQTEKTTWCGHDASAAIRAGIDLELLDIKDAAQVRIQGKGEYRLSRIERNQLGWVDKHRVEISRMVTSPQFLNNLGINLNLAIKSANAFVAIRKGLHPDSYIGVWVELTIIALVLA